MDTWLTQRIGRIFDELEQAAEVGRWRARRAHDRARRKTLEEVGVYVQAPEYDLLEELLIVTTRLVTALMFACLNSIEPLERPTCRCSRRLCSALLTGSPDSSASSMAK